MGDPEVAHHIARSGPEDASAGRANILRQQTEKDARWEIYKLFPEKYIDHLLKKEGVTREQYLHPQTPSPLQRIRRFFRRS